MGNKDNWDKIERMLETIRMCEGKSVIIKEDKELLQRSHILYKDLQIYIREIKRAIVERRIELGIHEELKYPDSDILRLVCMMVRNSSDLNTLYEYIKFIKTLLRLRYDFYEVWNLGRYKENPLLECGECIDSLKVWRLNDKAKYFNINGKMRLEKNEDDTLIINGVKTDVYGIILLKDKKVDILKDRIKLIERMIDINSYDYAITTNSVVNSKVLEYLDNRVLSNKEYIWAVGLTDIPTAKEACKFLRLYKTFRIQSSMPSFINLYTSNYLDIDNVLKNMHRYCKTIQEKGDRFRNLNKDKEKGLA